ncbi:MAG: DNA polymerase III subunit alpha [Pirellulales bacterium]
MADLPFVHLHCHSHYSLLDGASPIPKLIAKAKQQGMNSLALTDHGNLYGALEFYQKARAAEINPIVGYEAYIAPGSRFQKEVDASGEASFHLTLLAQNRTGFKNLVKLASSAYLEGFYRKPRIDKEILSAHSEGLVCLSGCVSGEFSRALLRGGNPELSLEQACNIAGWFRDIFGERYFIEIQNNGLEIQRLALEGAVDVAKKMGIPLVATSDAHYVNREDAEAQDVLLCINTGKFRRDTDRMKMEGDQFYLRGPQEMYASFPGLEDAVKRSQEIADTVDIQLDLKKRHFPTFTIPDQKTPEDYLRELCIAGLKDRYRNQPDYLQDGELSQVVLDRLERELYVINKLGFPNYFLIVWDFVRFARERGIQATARGSGVGSLVAFGTYLSHVCPLKYDLLFERFLDESRLEAPDIDIDFCQERREEVIQYVKERYGSANVAQIGTFGTLKARAAIRDVGRALGIPIPKVDSIVAMVPDELGISLAEALEQSEDLKRTTAQDAEVRELLSLAQRIEGLARNVGTHAAAVVIADQPLVEYVPLCRVKDKEESITQWAMGDVEAAGLLKMDFLGLRNLTILSKAIDLIEQTRGERIDPYSFPLEDKETFALLCRGETKGIFQLESGGIRDLLQRMKPDHFRDIIATNALYRPGPLEGGMVDDYIQVKHGRQQAEYKHAVMRDVLGETHGVMVYQEQVMRILNRLGGIELPKAYTCIKAISKKKLETIAKFRQQFLEGSTAQGLSKKDAEEMFGMIEKFAGYGFNKCVVGESAIVHAETGERTTVEELFKNRRPWTIHALDERGKLRPRNVSDVVWNGRKRVLKLTTARGLTLTATDNHPLRTLKGWTFLGELRPGDRIASARGLRVDSPTARPRHELILLAGLLSEGNTCHPTCLYFYNNCRALVEDFREAAEQFPDSVARLSERRGGRYEVCVSTGQDARFKPGQRPWNAGPQADKASSGIAEELVTLETSQPARSGAFRWVQQLGLLSHKASQKCVPAFCHALREEDLELFIGRLWAGDGFVGAPGQIPYYATSSPCLAGDVQALLTRLRIVSRVTKKSFRYRYRGEARERTGYTVHLLGREAIDRFLSHVAPHALGREQQVARFAAYIAERAADLTSKDTVPGEVREWVDADRRRLKLGWRDLQAQSGVSMKEFVGQGSKNKRGFRRSTIERLARFFESRRLQDLAQSDLFWDTVVAVEPAGMADTYDLTVEEDHNFVANGLVVHNSHSTAYALIAYMTAYLKTHYKVEFMAALLSGDISGRNFKKKDALVEHMEDCRRMGIEVCPPNVNQSNADFAVDGTKVFFGLSAVKGCGGSAGAGIMAARKKDGPFKSIFDFCERVDPQTAGRAVIESLIKAGAFDCTGGNRNQLMQALDRAMQSGASAHADRRAGQRGLFGDEDDEPQQLASLPIAADWDDREKLANEKEVLGFYLSSHPLSEHSRMLSLYSSHNTVEAATVPHKTEVYVGGMISAIKFSNTKNPRPGQTNTRYAMFDLEDMQGMLRTICWPEQFAQQGHLVQADAVIMVRGSIEKRPGSEEATFLVNELIPLDQVESRFTRGVAVKIEEQRHNVEQLERLREIFRSYPGNCELELWLWLADGAKVKCKTASVRVAPDPEMRERVEELLGSGNFRFMAAAPTSSLAPRQNGNGNGYSREKARR